MTWSQPTYEDYLRATPFARMRYKWGLFVQIASWLTIIALFVYCAVYVKELSTNPLQYAAEKFGLDCYCKAGATDLIYTFNSSSVYTSPLNPIETKFPGYT